LRHGHTIAIYFTCCNEVPGAIVCPRPEQLVRSTPLLPWGMPKDAKSGLACVSEAGRDYSFLGLQYSHIDFFPTLATTIIKLVTKEVMTPTSTFANLVAIAAATPVISMLIFPPIAVRSFW
jgi:hypothetical protein